MNLHGGAALLASSGGRRRPWWRSALLAVLLLAVPLAGVVAPVALQPAGAQGGWVGGPTALTSEIFENYSGWSWPGWQIAGGGDAGFRAWVRLDYPSYIRAGQPFNYRRCVTWIETNETNIYETGINGVSLTGSIEMTGTAYSQGGWSGTGASVCREYGATAPTATGSQTISVPSDWLRPSQAVGYAGSCCGGFGWRGYAGTTNNTFTTTVLQNPVAADDSASVAQGGLVTITPLVNDTGFTGTDSGTATGLSITANATKGTCVAAGSVVYYFHSGGATGTDMCTYAINQAETDDMAVSNGPATAVITLNISGPPVAVDDESSTTEDDALTFDPRANDTDPESGELTITAVDATGTQGTVSFTPTSVTFTPGPTLQQLQVGESATTTFGYTIADPAGITDIGEVTVTVAGANDAPVAVADAFTTGENGPAITYDVRTNDTDVDTGDAKTVTAVDSTGTQGTVTFTGADVTYTPSGYEYLVAGETATTTFAYTVTDSQGATATSTVTVTIAGENNAPTVVADTALVAEDGPAVEITPVVNDTDQDTGDVLALQSAALLSGLGSVSVAGDTVTYDPAGNYGYLGVGDTAPVLVTYTVVDSAGATSTGMITITVSGVNDAGVGVDDAYGTDDVSAITVNPVSANDTDPDASDVLTITGVDTAGVLGSVTFAGNDVTYDPSGVWNQIGSTMSMLLFEDQTATETFTYTVTDGNGWTDTVTVTVTVEGTLSRTADSDGGGVPDWIELIIGTDPTDPSDDPLDGDSDGNGIPDWHEFDMCGAIGCEELPTAPAACPTANNLLELVRGTVAPGELVEVRADTGWLAHSTVAYFVCSAPTFLDEVSSGADGRGLAALSIPADLEPGDHLVFGLGLDEFGDPAIKTLGFTVDEAPITTVAPTTTTAASTTTAKVAGTTQAATPAAKSGAAVGSIVLTGAALLLVGAALVVTARRRRRLGDGS